MTRSSRPRKLANLSDSLHQQLNMYALAASAAGVGVLALSAPAEAKIVYKRAHVMIVPNQGLVQLDVNNDGTPDFAFSNTTFRRIYYSGGERLRVGGDTSANEVWGTQSKGKLVAVAAKRNQRIGPRRPFQSGNHFMAAQTYQACDLQCTYHTTYGPWRGATNRYLGLKFSIHGQIHYGWARLTVSNGNNGKYSATLTGYAYETVPNKAIIAGHTKGSEDENGVEQPSAATLPAPASKPASLGLLAMGADGLSVWRRESVDSLP
jgi:hypothetical protein